LFDQHAWVDHRLPDSRITAKKKMNKLQDNIFCSNWDPFNSDTAKIISFFHHMLKFKTQIQAPTTVPPAPTPYTGTIPGLTMPWLCCIFVLLVVFEFLFDAASVEHFRGATQFLG
jgi:hypothetical protein